MALSKEMREQMCRLCRDKRCRKNEFSRERPTVWQPTQVMNPEYQDYGMCFTPTGAWHFIADLLEKGHEFLEKTLNKPPGAIAYEARVLLADGKIIYIKIQPSGNIIFGRSFHYDTPPT